MLKDWVYPKSESIVSTPAMYLPCSRQNPSERFRECSPKFALCFENKARGLVHSIPSYAALFIWDPNFMAYDLPAEPSFPAECIVSFGGMASFVLLAALPIAALITWITITLYRRKILVVMRSLSDSEQHCETNRDSKVESRTNLRPLITRYIGSNPVSEWSPFLAKAHAHAKRAGIAYAVAGIVHALIATILTFSFSDIPLLPVRVFMVAYLYAWPVIPTLMLTSINNPRTKWLWLIGYFAILFGFDFSLSAFGLRTDPNSGSLFSIWLVWMGVPSLLLWILSNRAWRSVGLMAYFLSIAMVAAWLLSTQGLGCLALTFNDVSIWSQYRWLAFVGMLLLLLGSAWWMLHRIAIYYRSKRISDQSLVLDSWWLVITLVDIVIQFDATRGASVSMVLAWLVYRWISRALQPSSDDSTHPPTLLLLRVFGHRRRSRRLLDQLGQRWRHIGPISLIGAPDLAATNLEPDQLMKFWALRLRELFVTDLKDLQNRMQHFDNRPDSDGRYRINEFFCYDNTWRETVHALAKESEVVIMDLRGFGAQHQGCRFELNMLLNNVPLKKILLLIDASTDKAALESELASLWQQLRKGSVNRGTLEPVINIFEATDSLYSVDLLLEHLTIRLRVKR